MQLRLEIPENNDMWDSDKEEFTHLNKQTLILAHSLVSISKWERKWKKPFFSRMDDKTPEELKDYIRCMTVNQVDPLVYNALSVQDLERIRDYMADSMTATTFSQHARTGANAPVRNEDITSELIYYKMISLGIPIEFERWHINALLALIKVFEISSGENPKMTKAETQDFYRSLHESRKKRK